MGERGWRPSSFWSILVCQEGGAQPCPESPSPVAAGYRVTGEFWAEQKDRAEGAASLRQPGFSELRSNDRRLSPCHYPSLLCLPHFLSGLVREIYLTMFLGGRHCRVLHKLCRLPARVPSLGTPSGSHCGQEHSHLLGHYPRAFTTSLPATTEAHMDPEKSRGPCCVWGHGSDRNLASICTVLEEASPRSSELRNRKCSDPSKSRIRSAPLAADKQHLSPS